ncbi:MAG: hypothetical protein V1825_01925 [Candidatus Falkowbacteria bacterium]
MKTNIEMPQLNKDEAQKEATQMQEKINSNEVKNYNEAEKRLTNESFIRHHIAHALLGTPENTKHEIYYDLLTKILNSEGDALSQYASFSNKWGKRFMDASLDDFNSKSENKKSFSLDSLQEAIKRMAYLSKEEKKQIIEIIKPICIPPGKEMLPNYYTEVETILKKENVNEKDINDAIDIIREVDKYAHSLLKNQKMADSAYHACIDLFEAISSLQCAKSEKPYKKYIKEGLYYLKESTVWTQNLK